MPATLGVRAGESGYASSYINASLVLSQSHLVGQPEQAPAFWKLLHFGNSLGEGVWVSSGYMFSYLEDSLKGGRGVHGGRG